jgi:U3 small nucleolar RNA-associated protein 12
MLHESGIADSLNRVDAPLVVEGVTGDSTRQSEVASVTKQTTETLMAGERIMEALDLADGERAAFKEYETSMSRLPEDAMRLQPPPRNQVLAAYDLDPDMYVLKVIEKVPNTALQDALLVLPFGKVVSLMNYLNQWAQKVIPTSEATVWPLTWKFSGVEPTACFTYHLLLTQNPPSPDRC